MFVKTTDLNNLLALPASRQHWALLPVVDIDRLLVEVLIILTAEVASLFVDLFGTILSRRLCLSRRWTLPVMIRIHLLLGTLHIILRILIHGGSSLSTRCTTCCTGFFVTSTSCAAFSSHGIYISLDNFLALLGSCLRRESLSACFGQQLLYLVNLGLS